MMLYKYAPANSLFTKQFNAIQFNGCRLQELQGWSCPGDSSSLRFVQQGICSTAKLMLSFSYLESI